MRAIFTKTKFFCGLALLFSMTLAACVDPGATHKSDVYEAGEVNKRQEVKSVNIITIQPAKVQVSNKHNQEIAQGIGAIFGAALGGAIGNNNDDDGLGVVLGTGIGSAAGAAVQRSKVLVDGVQIIYKEADRILSSAQVAKPCEFAPGPALVIVTESNETRIQSNHDCVEGQEMVVGQVSKLAGFGDALGSATASDQNTLDDLERQRELTRKKQEVQEAKTGLAQETGRTTLSKEVTRTAIAKEAARTKNADRSVEAEIRRDEAINEAIVNESKKEGPTTVIIK
ncbi:MAG: hypothetical protein ACR2OT_03905 [Parvibaculales bacterium]